MRIGKIYGVRSATPRYPYYLDRGHPLAKGLLICTIFGDRVNGINGNNASGHGPENIADQANPGTGSISTAYPTSANGIGGFGLKIGNQGSGRGAIYYNKTNANGAPTLSVWVRASKGTATSSYGRLLASDVDSAGNVGFLLGENPSGNWAWIFQTGGGYSAELNATPTGVGKVDNVCGTWDGSTLAIYMNGQQKATSTKTGTLVNGNIETLVNRLETTTANQQFLGIIYQVMMWLRPISYNEVRMLEVDPLCMLYRPQRWAQLAVAAPPPPAFNAGWAARNQRVIGTGVY